jgi:hypothetical protein
MINSSPDFKLRGGNNNRSGHYNNLERIVSSESLNANNQHKNAMKRSNNRSPLIRTNTLMERSQGPSQEKTFIRKVYGWFVDRP